MLTSAVPSFFSAGIDLGEFTKGKDHWLHYWKTLRETFLDIYTAPMPTVAAINGHAPGAGAVFSLACHHRIMLRGKYGFGLNEVAVGMPVPEWLCTVMANTTSVRTAERMLPFGSMVNADTGLASGLVDSAVDSPEQLREAALKQVLAFNSVSFFAQSFTYKNIRSSFAAHMRATEDEDMKSSWSFIGTPAFQDQLARLRASLAAKKPRKDA